MATLLHAESRRKYSWWWDSHNSPKNSKWLQENLTDMDAKVKSMIKLIEEDADSFARRAEMYYKKRPELMKLVEEFYRAYRALAERYNHATGELRHAHRTIAKAFPDQVPPELVEDSPLKPVAHNWDPHTPIRKFPVRALFGKEDDETGSTESNSQSEERIRKWGLDNEKEEVEGLKKALADTQAEKEDVLLHYQQCLEKLSNIERELSNAQKDSKGLNEKASNAEIEVQKLKDALVQLEAEKNAGMVKHEECLEKISNLENMLSRVNTRALEAENEAQSLKDEILRLELEKEAILNEHKEYVEKISVLENVVALLESEAVLLKKQAEIAENEVSELKKSISKLNEEKEASVLQYKCCLETISKLEKDLSNAKEDVKRLTKDILLGNSKLRTAEEKCSLLEMSNLSLRTEAENLVKKIHMKDQELSEKQEELENLQNCLQNEHSRYTQVEATLHSLQSLHSQSQDDHRVLSEELRNVLGMLKDLEASKKGLEEEIQELRDENQSLSEMNLSSAFSVENMQNEIISLKEIKERLEKEVSRHVDLSNSLQQEILSLKEEINGLKRSYAALVEQVEAAGLNPECVGTSIKSFEDESSKLREINEKEIAERELLSKKLEKMQELLKKKEVEESSLSVLNNELEISREKVKALQDSCQFLNGEKAALVAEKASLFSQIQAITENMHKVLEKNAALENSLSTAKVELEGLREKSKGLEEICELLKNERSYLLTERGNLAFKLENVERRLESLEKRCNGLEEKCAGLEKEKESVHFQVEELKVSLNVEKQERTSSQLQSETRLVGLEDRIHFLQEENRWNKKEYEEEIEKSLKAQFEISILQKFMKDMEEKNYSLIIECQKHVEASKLAEKLISELESESLEQQVEAELLLDEIERLRLSIYQIFRALEKTGQECHSEGKIENDRTFVNHILGNIEEMRRLISKQEDDKQELLVENSVLVTLLKQLESKGTEIESQKIYLEQEFKNMAEKFTIATNEKENLLELNEKLRTDVSESHERAGLLEAELESLNSKQVDLNKAYAVLNEAYLQLNRDNENLLKKFSDLKEEKYQVDQHYDSAVLENLATANQSEILRSFVEEKLREVKSLLEDLSKQGEVNIRLQREMGLLSEKLELQKAENLLLKDAVHKLEKEMQGMREFNVQMKKEIVNGKDSLRQTEGKLLNAEVKLEAAEKLNLQLCTTVDELKMDFQESMQIRENLEQNIFHLCENDSIQKKEIEGLHRVKTELESDLRLLREEMEEKIIREQILSSELQSKNNEFQLWESEASAFYFDLQISSVNEILFRNKVEELTGVCVALENESSSKTSEIAQMKRKICSMESEISGLKSQLNAYAPVIASLKDDIAVLEHNAILQTKLKASRNQEPEFSEAAAEKLPEDQSIITLQNLQMRIKAVGKMMEDTSKPSKPRRSASRSKQETGMIEAHPSKSRGCLGRPDHSRKKGYAADNDTPKLQKIKTKASEVWNGMLTKDIPLDQVSNTPQRGARTKKGNTGRDDQMLELWETAEDRTIGESLRLSYKMTEEDIVYDHFENSNSNSSSRRRFDPPSTDSDVEKELGMDKMNTEPKREVSARRILERLNSDAQKLENLQITVQNLREKLETSNKKSRKSAKNVDFETVHEQLVEAEETVEHLVGLNGQLVKNMEECPSPDAKASPIRKEAVRTRRRKVTEQARKGSERIGRLQLEVQKIQYILLKMGDEKKNNKNKFFKNKTIVLRDFIGNGRKNSIRRKKGPLCGCFRPSSSKSGRSSISP